jgi:hypothetical protein
MITIDLRRRWTTDHPPRTWEESGPTDPEERRKHLLAGTGVDYAEGVKLTDPRRMAVYFAKYGTAGNKEYQHQVPREWITTWCVRTAAGTTTRPATTARTAAAWRLS